MVKRVNATMQVTPGNQRRDKRSVIIGHPPLAGQSVREMLCSNDTSRYFNEQASPAEAVLPFAADLPKERNPIIEVWTQRCAVELMLRSTLEYPEELLQDPFLFSLLLSAVTRVRCGVGVGFRCR